MGSVPVKVTTSDSTPAAIDGVLVQVYDELGAFITQGLTGGVVAGEADFTLNGDADGETYFLLLHKDGWYFSDSPKKEISVTDPPSPDNQFDYTGTQGTVMQPVVIVVKDDTSSPQPVNDVEVLVYDDSDTFVTQTKTGAQTDGEAALVLTGAPDPGTPYSVLLNKPGVTFASGSVQRIWVVEDVSVGWGDGTYPHNTFEFAGHLRDIPESLDQNLCKLSGWLVDAGGEPVPGIPLTFKLVPNFPSFMVGGLPASGFPTVIEEGRILSAERAVKTDSAGYIEVSLVRGGIYDVHFGGLENPRGLTSTIAIPDAAGVRLEDVLFPYVQEVSYLPTSVSVAVGESVEVAAAILLSDSSQILPSEVISQAVQFSVGDETIAQVRVTGEGTLTVTGVGVGSTQLSVTRAEGTWAPRRPEVDDVVVTPLAITVS